MFHFIATHNVFIFVFVKIMQSLKLKKQFLQLHVSNVWRGGKA